MDYKKAGVDIDLERRGINAITQILKKTYSLRKTYKPLEDFGSFASLVDFGDFALAISTDGVGSKVLVAQKLKKFDTIGIDLVAMSVNDVLCVGAEPICMVDYVAMQMIDENLMEEIGKGVYEGARKAKISVVGGETATLPEILKGFGNAFDLVGTCIGVVRKERIVTGKEIRAGDFLIGIESSGIHSNGLTLARKVLGEEIKLLTPTRIYVRPVLELLERVRVKGIAHITGGGFLNLSRLGWGLEIHVPEPPYIFKEIQDRGDVETFEMYKTFNMGIGFCVVVSKRDVEESLKVLCKYYKSHVLGRATEEKKIFLKNKNIILKNDLTRF
ncbi:MAG: phosphoribosylformylglycinamidine cyclo-ligase [Candidatus Methanofastidiosia archaeon]